MHMGCGRNHRGALPVRVFSLLLLAQQPCRTAANGHGVAPPRPAWRQGPLKYTAAGKSGPKVGSVPRHAWDSAEAQALLSARKPVVLTGTASGPYGCTVVLTDSVALAMVRLLHHRRPPDMSPHHLIMIIHIQQTKTRTRLASLYLLEIDVVSKPHIA